MTTDELNTLRASASAAPADSELRMVAAYKYANALAAVDDPASVDWFREAVAASTGAPATMRLRLRFDIATRLNDGGRAREAFEVMLAVVDDASFVNDRLFPHAMALYFEIAAELAERSDHRRVSLFEKVLDTIVETEERTLLRGRAAMALLTLGFREAAIVQSGRIAHEISTVRDSNMRAALICTAAEILTGAGLPELAVEAIDEIWDCRQEVSDPMLAYWIVRARLRSRIGSSETAEVGDLVDAMLAAVERTGRDDEFVTACSLAASALVELGRPDDAVRMAERGVQSLSQAAPDALHALAFAQLGDILRLVGRGSESLAWFERAARMAVSSADGKLRGLVELRRAEGLASQHLYYQSWKATRNAAELMFTDLSKNPFIDGIAGESAVYERLFNAGVGVAESLLRLGGAGRESVGAELLALLDSGKCVATREGLRRQSAQPPHSTNRDPWRGTLVPPWAQRSVPARAATRVRGIPCESALRRSPRAPLRIQSATDELTFQFPDATRLRFATPAILLSFFFSGDDLLVLPLLADGDERRVLLSKRGPFRVSRCRRLLDQIAHEHGAIIGRILDDFDAADPTGPAPDSRILSRDGSRSLRSVYEEAFTAIEGERIVETLRTAVADMHDHHLVIFPDGPLYELAIHACPVGIKAGSRFEDLFASVSYASSLRTLELQQRLVRSQTKSALRGVLMATPEPNLPGVGEEVAALAGATRQRSWWIHGDDGGDNESSYANFLRRHGAGNLLWLCGHGGAADEEGPEGGFQLSDEPVDASRLLDDPYDFSSNELIVLNACWMGAMRQSGTSHEVTAFNTILAVRGAARVTSALWAVDDRAAVVFADAYIRALMRRVFRAGRRAPFAFAVALREAVASLRADSRYEHEFFWAPWILYGAP